LGGWLWLYRAAIVDGLEALPQIAAGGMGARHHDVGPFFQFHLPGRAQHHVHDEFEPGANGDLFHLLPDRVVDMPENLIDPRAGDEVGPARGYSAGDSRLHHRRCVPSATMTDMSLSAAPAALSSSRRIGRIDACGVLRVPSSTRMRVFFPCLSTNSPSDGEPIGFRIADLTASLKIEIGGRGILGLENQRCAQKENQGGWDVP
jgi:hypothetical protein